MGISNLTGTPWHVEKYTRKEGDQRRHQSRCVYYSKKDKQCSKIVSKCCGSAHCDYYCEKAKPEQEIKSLFSFLDE